MCRVAPAETGQKPVNATHEDAVEALLAEVSETFAAKYENQLVLA